MAPSKVHPGLQQRFHYKAICMVSRRLGEGHMSHVKAAVMIATILKSARERCRAIDPPDL
jgi:hypothetical protein